jgi:hypothetical protein
MRKLFVTLILFSCSLSFFPARSSANPNRKVQSNGITDKNWQTHPEITAIRHVVGSVNSSLKKHALKTTERKYESCGDQYFTSRRIGRDAKGVTRWYRDYSEGEDASFDFNYYYDANGKLRFVFATVRAGNGTREQLRIYFDESARRIWQSHKSLKGPGCPGCFYSYLDSDEALVFALDKAFADDAGCKPLKVDH